MPGAFKLDHLQPFEAVKSHKIFNFFSFILGGQFLLPQSANNGKGEFIQLQNRMRQGVFSAWGIQTRPFAALCTSHFLRIFQLFHFYTGRPILITPEGQYWEKGNLLTSKVDETEGFQCLWHSNWTICILLNIFCSEIFQLFHLHTGEPNLITPDDQ